MIYGIMGSFASIFMLAKGYSNSQIGLTLAGGNVLALLLQPWIADYADRSDRAAVIRIPVLLTGLMMALIGGLFVFRDGSAVMILAYIVILAFHSVIQPLLNTMPFRYRSIGVDISYGVGRAGGSAGFSIMLFVLGTIVEKRGVMSIPLWGEIACALFIALMLVTGLSFRQEGRNCEDFGEADAAAPAAGDPADGDSCAQDTGTRADEYEEIRIRQFIKRNRMFFLLNLGMAGIFCSNSVLTNYMAQISADVGGTTEQLGRILSLMAILEIPTMLFYGKIRERFGSRPLIKLAALGFSAKIILCWLAESVAVLFAAQFFQLIAFALMMPAMVYFIDEIMSRGEAVKGQSLFTMMIVLATVVSSIAGGWLLDASGAKALTFVAAVVTVAGAVVILLTVDRAGLK